MNDFSYSIVRSFNQYMNGSDNLAIGADEQLILTKSPHTKMDRDTVTVEFYDEVPKDYLGRRVGSTTGRHVDLWCQIDCWSPPNSSGEPRAGANRKLKDKVEQVWKDTPRFPVISYGTAGTQVEVYAYIRQEGASTVPVEDMVGWTRWRLNYHMWAIDTET